MNEKVCGWVKMETCINTGAIFGPFKLCEKQAKMHKKSKNKNKRAGQC